MSPKHRLSPRGPLSGRKEDWEAQGEQLLLDDTPVPLEQAARLVEGDRRKRFEHPSPDPRVKIDHYQGVAYNQNSNSSGE